MSYHCPLCLKLLTEDDNMARVCVEHPPRPGSALSDFSCSDQNLEDEIFCPEGGRCNGVIDTGVFLSHLECEAVNPFWDGARVDIPGQDSTTVFQMNTPAGTRDIQISHWQIKVLRRMPPTVRGMWFPLMLMRALAEAGREPGEKRTGALVELAGASTVGKSVLAMQAMVYKGYVPVYDGARHVDVAGYMFSRMPPGGSALTNPFLANLYYNYLMRMNKDGLQPLPQTRRMPGDVKVAFVAPRVHDAPPPDNPAGNSRRGVFAFVLQIVRDVIKVSRTEAHKFWYTVAFYDAAGEEFLEDGSIPEAIEKVVDKVAVLVDAAEIHGLVSGDSIAVANERLKKAKAQDLPCCLVVTKLDLVVDRLSQEEQSKVRAAAEDLSAAEGPERELLDGWLKLRVNHGSAGELRSRLQNIERVFFVWTEGLPEATAQGTVQVSVNQPRSFGLAKFICWCLGVEWSALNRGR